MKQLAIYHEPQECGEPFVMLVDLETGKEIKSYTIPAGYYHSGCSTERYYQPTGKTFTRTHSGGYLPKIGTMENYRRNKCAILSDITDIKPWDFPLDNGESLKGYDALLHYSEVIEKYTQRFDAKEDSFRKEMEEQGFNMRGWCVYRRRKTSFEDFLRAILSSEVVNIIFI